MPIPLQPGGMVRSKGFVTRLNSVVNQPADELERRLGYNRGRLAAGWALLLLKPLKPEDRVVGADFRFAGYTHFSGGRIGDPRLGSARPNVHAELKRNLANPARFADEFAAQRFPVTGPERIVRIVPISAPDPVLAESALYPTGAGVPQWILTVEKWFLVATVVRSGSPAPGSAHLPPGFWIDPVRAQTL